MARKRLTNEAIVAALIECGSVKAAAAKLECTPRTLYTRMKEPDFKEQYTQAKTEILRTATAKLQNHLSGAVDTLAEVMNDPETAPQTRTNAASTILSYGARFTEAIDIIDRLEAVEEAYAKTGTR